MSNLTQFFSEISPNNNLTDFLKDYINDNISDNLINLITPDFNILYEIFVNLDKNKFKLFGVDIIHPNCHKYIIINGFTNSILPALIKMLAPLALINTKVIVISNMIQEGYDKMIITNQPINTNYDITKVLDYLVNNNQIEQYFNDLSGNNLEIYNNLITFFQNYLYNQIDVDYINFVTPKFNIIFDLIDNLKEKIPFTFYNTSPQFKLFSVKTKYIIVNRFNSNFDIDLYLPYSKYSNIKFIIISKSPVKSLNKYKHQTINIQNINNSNYDLSEIFNFIVETKSDNMHNFILELSNNDPIKYKQIIQFFGQYYSHTLNCVVSVLAGPYSIILDLINLKLSTGFKLWNKGDCPILNSNEYLVIDHTKINVNKHMNFLVNNVKILNTKYILVSSSGSCITGYKDNIFIEAPKNKYNLGKLCQFCIDNQLIN
jgi:hypothetical protein